MAVCTIVYVLVGLVLTGMVPINQIDTHAPIAHAMRLAGQDWVAGLISLGAITGLTSVLIGLMLASTRILFAMSRDNYLPSILKSVHKKYKTPHIITVLTALICMLGTLFLNISTAAELCNFGTFTSFIILGIAVLILRKTDPTGKGPFRLPFQPLSPILGEFCCAGFLFFSLHFLTTSRVFFPPWFAI